MELEHEIHALLSLNILLKLRADWIGDLIDAHGSAAAALEAGPAGWRDRCDSELISNELTNDHELDKAKLAAADEYALATKLGLRFLLRHFGPYPRLLRESTHSPVLLFLKGNLDENEEKTVALVGARRPSFYGEKMARVLSRELCERGVVTVSGLARGIDSVVHRESLEAGGVTWAVVGCGLSRCYPPENKRLMDEIAERGAVISEYPINEPPYPGNFPRRNRIIAALSYGTVVVEGTETSGALITARMAACEGREVFAVPGPVTSPLSEAPHRLIQYGAKLIRNADEIIEEFPSRFALRKEKDKAEMPVLLSELDEKIIKAVTGAPLPRESLAQIVETSPSELAAALLQMEMRGLVKMGAGGLIHVG